MSFKLYDFDKEIIPEELDEQIRLICDILYNKREEYPQQLVPTGFAGGMPRRNPATEPFLVNSSSVSPNGLGSGWDVYGGITTISLNTPAGSTPIETPEGKMAKVATTTTLNNTAGVRTDNNSPAANWLIAERNPYFETWVKLATDLLNHTIGIGSAQGTQVFVNAYNTALSQGTSLWGFVFDTTLNATNWVIRMALNPNSGGGTITTDVNTGVPVVANRNYILKMKLNRVDAPSAIADSHYNISWSIEQFDFTITGGITNYLLTQGLIVNQLLVNHDTGVNNRTNAVSVAIKNIVGGAGTNRSWFIGYIYQETELPGIR